MRGNLTQGAWSREGADVVAVVEGRIGFVVRDFLPIPPSE